MTKKAPEKLYESKPVCVVTKRYDGSDNVTFCTVMEWMLDADKKRSAWATSSAVPPKGHDSELSSISLLDALESASSARSAA